MAGGGCSDSLVGGGGWGLQALFQRSQSSSPPSQRSHNIRRAKLAVQDGQYNKAIKTLSSDDLATPSAEVMQEMLVKYPQTTPPVLPPGTVPPSATVTESTVQKAVRSFPHGSAPGPTGLRPSHLQEGVGCPSPDQANLVLASLTKIVNSLAAGRAPPPIIPHFCGATLLACKKRSGGHRPIAVGEVLRRLVSKSLAILVRSPTISLLSPLQLGVSVRGGCEAIVHATSHLMSSLPNKQRWSMQLDFINAFNNINREAMYAEVRHHLPGLSAWMEACYSCQPLLHLGTNSIHSCCGVQQGDPLGPLGFALTLHPIVEHIKAEVPTLALNAWYLDDGILVGSPEDLLAALRIVETAGPSVGFHLNRGKSLLSITKDCDSSLSPLPPEIPVTRAGFCLLCCPIGPPPLLRESGPDQGHKDQGSIGGAS